jgi:hypothetical protein
VLAARRALVKNADASLGPVSGPLPESSQDGLYGMGFHYVRYVSASGVARYVPSMQGSEGLEVNLYPNQMASIVIANPGLEVLGHVKTRSEDGPVTIRAVDRLAPF